MIPVTVDGADSAEALYREGAAMLDVDRGEVFCNGQRHRIVDLLSGATVILAYGARLSPVDSATRLLDGWGIPAWSVIDADVEDLRRRVADATHVRSRI